MPFFPPDTDVAGTGDAGGAATGVPGVPTTGVEHIGAILTTSAGTVAASATQLFSSPHMDRRRVTITNCDATAGQYLYVGFDSSVSATRYRWRLDAGDPPVSIDCGPGVNIYIFGDAANTNYHATEESLAVA